MCDDAAKARLLTSAVVLASGLIVSAGVAYIFRPTFDERSRHGAEGTAESR